MKIHLKRTALPTEIVDVADGSSVGDLRAVVASRLKISEDENIKLIFQGRILQDDSLPLSAVLTAAEATVYVSTIKRASGPQTIAPVSSESPEDPQVSRMLATMMGQNPELFQQALMSNPQIKSLMEKNPMIRQVLEDPAVLQELLQVSSNPQAMQAMMQGQERMMSQLENVPQGFQMLQQMQSDIGRADQLMMAGSGVRRKPSVAKLSQGINRAPLANPWAPQPSSPRSAQSPNVTDLPPQLQAFLQAQYQQGEEGDGEGEEEPTRTRAEYRTLYEAQLKEMRSMGFGDEEANLDALIAAHGDLFDALEFLDEAH